MQAGEKIAFVQPFDMLEQREASARESVKVQQTFVALCARKMQQYEEAIQQRERLEESGFITAFEVPLKVQAEDGSYLHILIFGHHDNTAYFDFALAVAEHSSDTRLLGGYIYHYGQDGVTRTKLEGEDDVYEERPHYSLLASYDEHDAMLLAKSGDDDFEAQRAAEYEEAWKQAASMDMWEKELGADGQQPSLEEIQKLKEIVDSAELLR